MLRLSKEQKHTFEARAAELFPARLQVKLLVHLPEQKETLSGPEGRELIATRIEGAREHGFVGELDVARFVALGFVLGEGFSGEAWAKSILADTSFETPTDRVDALWAMAEHRELDKTADETARALGGKPRG